MCGEFEAGEVGQAATIYEEIRRADPGNVDALHLLGVLANDRAEHARAADLIGQAIELYGRNAAFHHNLAIAQRIQGTNQGDVTKVQSALAIYEEMLPVFDRARFPLDWGTTKLVMVTSVASGICRAIHSVSTSRI